MPSLNTKLASAPNTQTNYVLKATSSTTIGNSLIQDDGTNVAIGTTPATYKLNVNGTLGVTGAATLSSDAILSYGKALAFNSISNQYVTADSSFLYLGAGNAWRLKLDASNGYATFTSDIQGGGDLYFNKATRTTIYPTTTNQNLHIKSNGTGTLQFNDDVTGNVAMVVGGGKVGIGTSSPSTKLHIIQSLGNDAFAIGETGSNMRFRIGQEAGYTGNYIQSTNIDLKLMSYLAGGTGGNIIFQTGASDIGSLTDRMRITSAGNVGIGTSFVISSYLTGAQTSGVLQVATNISKTSTATTDSYPIGFFGSNDATYPLGLYIGMLTGSSTSTRKVKLQGTEIGVSPNDIVMQTDGAAVIIGTTTKLNSNAKFQVTGEFYMGLAASGAGNSTLKYNTSSGLVSYDTSARIYKKDIIDSEYGLDEVLRMSSKKYKWKSNDLEDLGFIADEMYQVVPEVVYLADNKINKTDLEDGEPMGINYDRLVPVLVKAIQELNQKVTDQQQQINQLINK